MTSVARDGGDIKFKSFENGVVKELQVVALDVPALYDIETRGAELLKHYVKEVNSVDI